MLYAYEVW